MRLIGDIHGNMEMYQQIIAGQPASIQLGDMGFSPTYKYLNDNVDWSKHRFIPGNHDDYSNLPPHAFQKDWGSAALDYFSFFYIRGAYSVDKQWRIPYTSWWPNEEIGYRSAIELIREFQELKPAVVLSHDCPFPCYKEGVLTNNWKNDPSFTTQFLTLAFYGHQPKLWVFGHHHRHWEADIDGTHFVCLGINDYIDIE